MGAVSLKAILWALEDAPVEDPKQLLVLIALADRAHDDGKDAYPARSWLATRTRMSVRSVQRKLNELEASGVIRRGNQTILSTRDYPKDRRPIVWDINLRASRGDKPGQAGCQTGSNGVTEWVERGDTCGTQTVLNRPGTVLEPARSKSVPLPDDWKPTEEHRRKAEALGVDVEATATAMRRWAFANDEKRERWNATFNQFLARAKPTSKPKIGGKAELARLVEAGDREGVFALVGERWRPPREVEFIDDPKERADKEMALFRLWASEKSEGM